MKFKNIIYLDSYIKIFLVRIEKQDTKQFCPELVKHLIIHYSIGLAKKKGARIKESVKINPKDIEFAEDYIIASFLLEELHKPYECEITIHTLTIFLKDSSQKRLKVDKKYQFRYLPSDFSEIKQINMKKTSKKSSPNLKKLNPSNTIKEEDKKEENNTEKDTSEHFISSYEKFKAKFQDTDFIELIRCKTSTIDFSLKNFGISLLCKLLLLIKYVNELVDNDFQNDLQEFLKDNILKSIEQEEVMT